MPFHDLAGVSTCRFKAREYILRRGEAMPYVYYLKRGEVNREVLTPYGSVTINTTKEGGHITGSIIGLLTIFDRNFDGICSDDFIAATDCICYRIPVDVCKQYMRAHPALMEEAFVRAIDIYNELEATLASLQDQPAPERVCDFLLRHSSASADGPRLAKTFSNVEIGKHLAVHTVTVSRIISALRREGIVTRTPEGLLVTDPEGLAAYARGQRRMKYD